MRSLGSASDVLSVEVMYLILCHLSFGMSHVVSILMMKPAVGRLPRPSGMTTREPTVSVSLRLSGMP